MKQLVTVEWLAKRLDDERLVVVDASIMASRGLEQGIPGAVRFDIDGEMSRADRGVHAMLPPKQFERALRRLGIRKGDRVVAYDADGIFSSARAWWMLRGAGIRAAVLDGGLPAWSAAGHPLGEVRDDLGREGDVEVRWDLTRFRDAGWVERRLRSGDPVLDARSAARFAGDEPEPRSGVRRGHIPGSHSVPFTSLQHEDGRMLPAKRLRSILADAVVDAEQPLTASCGSGVSACVIALAAEIAGFKHISVYDGSWAEWGADDSGRDVAIG